MSKSKTKADDAPEVFSARSKLDGVLQTLVDQKEEGSMSPEKDQFGRLETDGEFMENSPQSSPSKKSPRHGKGHRKRKIDREDRMQSELGQLHHTYIMKLFDRSVDLAQFREDTPLYPICRAWIKNQPNNHSLSQQVESKMPENESEREAGCIYKLPKPSDITVKKEDGQILSRIPSPLPQSDELFDIYADQNSCLPPESLLLNHMVRWKQVRQKWKMAARVNEARYSESLRVLRDMYDKQCNS